MDPKIKDYAYIILINSLRNKILFDEKADVLSNDYIKFNELYEMLKNSKNSQIRENLIVSKLKTDYKVIKAKNAKNLEQSIEIARKAREEFESNYEILFIKAKFEYAAKTSTSNTADYEASLNTYIAKCTPSSYPNAGSDLLEARCLMFQTNYVNFLENSDPQERAVSGSYIAKLIEEIKRDIPLYGRTCLVDFNKLYYDIAVVNFKYYYKYQDCLTSINSIEKPERIFNDKGNEYNLSYLRFMRGACEMKMGKNLDLALKFLGEVSSESKHYEYAYLCLLSINYKLENYREIVEKLSPMPRSVILSKFRFDYQAYLISAKFWYCFNDMSKLTDFDIELESEPPSSLNEICQFYQRFVKIWIGSSKDFSSLKPNTTFALSLSYDEIQQAAFKETYEFDFADGIIHYMQKSYPSSLECLNRYLSSGTTNKKSLIVTKFYICHLEFHLNRDKVGDPNEDLVLAENKLRTAAETLQNEIVDLEYFSNIKKEVYLFIGNIYFELLKITKLEEDARNAILKINEFFEPHFEYDEQYRVKLSICHYYLKQFKESMDLIEKANLNEPLAKYQKGLTLKATKRLPEALKILSEVIENFNEMNEQTKRKIYDIYYQRGIIYLQLPEPDYEKALSDFISQNKLMDHPESRDNIDKCLEKVINLCEDSEDNEENQVLFRCYLQLLFSEENMLEKTKWIEKIAELNKSVIEDLETEEHRIYISYSNESKSRVLAISNILTKLGFEVVMDKDSDPDVSKNSVTELEESFILLSFLTPQFAENSNCQLETQTASENEINMIPVLLQAPSQYILDLNKLTEKKLRRPNDEHEDLVIFDYFETLKEYFEEETQFVDMSSIYDNEDNFKEENLLNNQHLVELIVKLIELIYE